MEQINPSYYANIPANVRYDKDLTPNAKLLYGEITALCNKEGYCWAGNSYFAKLYGVKKETISRWITNLTKKGYLKTEIIYKLDSKEIDKRKIYLSEAYIQNNQYPIDEIINTPIDKKVKGNTTSINTTNNNKEHVALFEEWWNLYDHKKDKKKCRNKYRVLLKTYSHEEIINGTKKYLNHRNKLRKNGEFVPHKKYPHTFLNGENFMDEYDVVNKRENNALNNYKSNSVDAGSFLEGMEW